MTTHANAPRPYLRKSVVFGRNASEEPQMLDHAGLASLVALPVAPGGFAEISGTRVKIEPGQMFRVPVSVWSAAPPFIHRAQWVEEVTARDFERALYELPEPPPDDWAIATQLIGMLIAKAFPQADLPTQLDLLCRQLEVENPWEASDFPARTDLPDAEEALAIEPSHLYRGDPVRLVGMQNDPEGEGVIVTFESLDKQGTVVVKTVKEATWNRNAIEVAAPPQAGEEPAEGEGEPAPEQPQE